MTRYEVRSGLRSLFYAPCILRAWLVVYAMRLKEGYPMKALALALIFVAGTVATSYAQSSVRYYNKSGSYAGRSVSSGNTTRYYNKSGSYTGRATTSGSTTRYYNRSGSYVGRSSR